MITSVTDKGPCTIRKQAAIVVPEAQKDISLGPNSASQQGKCRPDFVNLPELKTVRGEPVRLVKGDELECWLEANDNCDYPNPAGNVGTRTRG